MTHHEPQEEYGGPATVVSGEARIPVDADLRGRFDPIDGRFHWYGRLAASPDLDAVGTGSTVTVTTEHGSAEGRLSDADPWGRLRVSGTGRPPF
ncbi:hypothetical protein ASC77_11570 [Nocardioides sp. Root1257]|uniref:DUF4873 domain-containing protein n=1 Tax=unclassified Nocardioides TaxID=2615069 RepID=UPI0006FDE2D5|nr:MULTISPECIES: DUF4873 domain-containing protein [unclassified Nocardioides]KQW49314.1 hypothetical protein ASC77_11570 [Nocardioides sp. Root1257]KRC48488.1 hypothetical protein ASE24_11575 [Nocardioides sp. Root224]